MEELCPKSPDDSLFLHARQLVRLPLETMKAPPKRLPNTAPPGLSKWSLISEHIPQQA